MKIIEGILYSDKTKVSIEIKNNRIDKIKKLKKFSDVNNEKIIIAPALMDNQVNGYGGIEFSKPDLSIENMMTIVKEHHKNGVSVFLPTVITASPESLKNSFKNLIDTLTNNEISESIPGFHLEGPYISPELGFRGIHSLKDIRKPNWDEFQKLNEIANGKIMQITLAPEIDGAIEFIEKCVANNIVVSLGHHNANSDEIKRAVEAGAKTVTHLGNGCANEINRFNNPFWMQLAEDRLMVSLILDGFHILPEIAKVFYRAKGNEKIILTSDMSKVAGLNPGKYIWENKEVILNSDGIILFPQENVFAGASFPLITSVSNMMKYTDCGLKAAINMASQNPAKLYGLNNIGTIEVGKRADLILFNFENEEITIQKTFVAGKLAYSRN